MFDLRLSWPLRGGGMTEVLSDHTSRTQIDHARIVSARAQACLFIEAAGKSEAEGDGTTAMLWAQSSRELRTAFEVSVAAAESSA